MNSSSPLEHRSSSLRNLIPLAVLALAAAFAPGLRAQIMDLNGNTLGFGNYTASPPTWTSNSTTIWTTSANGTSDTDTWFSLGGGSSSVTQFNTSNSSATTTITVAEDFAVQGLTATGPRGVFLSASANKTITLSPNAIINVSGGGFLTIGSFVTLSGNFTKTGSSNFRLGGVTSRLYAGTATVDAGLLELESTPNTSAATNIVLGSSGNLSLVNSGNWTIGNLSGGGSNSTFTSPTAGNTTFTITQTTDGSYSGRILKNPLLAANRSFAITKNGSATLTLSGNNTYDGVTTINSGNLTLSNTSGGGAGTGAVTISGGTLAVAPSGSGANVSVTGGTSVAGTLFTYNPGATLSLNKGTQSSLTYTFGATGAAFARGTNGTLILSTSDISKLGETVANGGERFIINGTAPAVVNNLVSGVVAQNRASSNAGDFVTYDATNGFKAATYTLTDTFAGSDATSVINIANQCCPTRT